MIIAIVTQKDLDDSLSDRLNCTTPRSANVFVIQTIHFLPQYFLNITVVDMFEVGLCGNHRGVEKK
jgi:hypothetical protein